MNDSTDAETRLLGSVAHGDTRAFERLYALTAPRVLGLIRRVLRDAAQSEEVAQEVFLEVWQAAARFDASRGSAVSWILRIAHSRAVDRVRAADASTARDWRVGIRDLAAVVTPVDELVQLELDSRAVGRALAQLPKPQRDAITLTHLQGYPQSEVAEMLHVPLGTVKTRVRDGLARIRRELTAA